MRGNRQDISDMIDALEQHYVAAGIKNIRESLERAPSDLIKTAYYKMFPEKLCEEVNYTYNYYPEYDGWILEMRVCLLLSSFFIQVEAYSEYRATDIC